MRKIFAIRDIKVECYHDPFYADDEISAVRGISMHMSKGESQLSQFASDYELYQIGEFDKIKGNITQLENKKFIISCTSILSNILRNTNLQKRLIEAAEKDKD